MPIRPDHYDFRFKSQALEAVRKQLGLTQAALADLLDVPVNTLSRWETGATTPDAHALAAIYSIARDHNVTPQFFQRRANVRQAQKQRTKLAFAWDFQNRALDASDVATEWAYMQRYIDLIHPGTKASRRLWAYISPHQWQAGPELEKVKFEVQQGYFDADSQLIQDALEVCQKGPNKTVFILAADDGNYVELLRTLGEMGVDTYVWGTDECSERLKKAVNSGHYIPWDAPFVITECVDVIRSLNGKQITRAEFGALCKQRLDEAEIYPYEVGFSAKNPYGSVLRWLERQGIVVVNELPGRQDLVSIKLNNKPLVAAGSRS